MGSDLGDLLLALTGRVRRERARGLTATVVLDGGAGAWTVRFERGRMTVGSGAAERPDTLIRADERTLVAINSGRETGADAFLEGRVTVRGNLGLALRLESLFEPFAPRPPGALEDHVHRVGPHRVSVIEAGVGDPVLLLHGLGATKASFLTTARALAGRYRVIVPDLLGHGDTSKPRGPYDPPMFARFVVDVMDALGIDRALLVGNSMGGRIAIETALRHPDRVRALALLCPAMAFIKLRQLVPVVRYLRPELAAVPMPIPRGLLIRSMRRLFAVPDRLPRSWYEAGADEFLRIWRDVRARVALSAATRSLYLDEPRGPDGFWTRLGGLERPALFVWGERDPLVPVAFSRWVTRTHPEAESVILDDCGHVPQFELPAATHKHVLDFFSRAA